MIKQLMVLYVPPPGLNFRRHPLYLFPFLVMLQVIFDVLLRKADLVEKFVAFANKPRLLQRFRERLADYKRFWQGVQVRYITWKRPWFTCLTPMVCPPVLGFEEPAEGTWEYFTIIELSFT